MNLIELNNTFLVIKIGCFYFLLNLVWVVLGGGGFKLILAQGAINLSPGPGHRQVF